MPNPLDKLRGLFRRSPTTTGARGESLAAKHLKQQGYRVLARNLRSALGEVDLLAETPDRKGIVIVEVKASVVSSARHPTDPNAAPRPEAHVNAAKQRKLTAVAAQLARKHGFTDRPIRFDVIGVDLPPHGCDIEGLPELRHHIHAFEATM